ncbi:MAG: GAF domain-containing protein [Armatimonadota bacterium]|nr:GAF domain-containing protein [Armatimonadota bacterium]
MRQQNEAFRALHEIAVALGGCMAVSDLLQAILSHACRFAGAPHGIVALYSPEEDMLMTEATTDTLRAYIGVGIRPGEGLGGRAWQLRRPVVVDDYDTWPCRRPQIPRGAVRAAAAVPFLSRGRPLGVLTVVHTDPGKRFDPEQVAMLTRFAEVAAIALDNAQQHAAVQRHARELELLHRVRSVLARAMDIPALFEAVVYAISDVFGYPRVAIYTREDAQLVCRAHTGTGWALPQIPIERGVNGRVVRTGVGALVRDVRLDPDYVGPLEGVASEVCVPLVDEAAVVGTLNVETPEGVRLGDDDLRLMTMVAEYVGMAMTRARLHTRVRDSERRFRALVQNSSDILTLLAADGTVLYQSPSIARVLGYAPEDLLGQNVFDYVHPEDRPAVRAEFQAMLRERRSGHVVRYRFRNAGGAWTWLESIGSDLRADPDIGAVVVNSRDVTERWEAEAALRARTAELEAVYELSTALRQASSVEEMYPIVVQRAVRLTRSDHGAIALLTPDGSLTFAHVEGALPHLVGTRLPPESLSGRVVASGVPFVAAAFPEDSGVRIGAEAGLGPVVIVPVRSDDGTIGTLSVARRRVPDGCAYAPHEVRIVEALAELAGNAIRRASLFAHLEHSYIEMVLALARAMDARDSYTAGHADRLAVWAQAVARRMGCHEQQTREIRWAALLHDIGKIGIPDSILLKPGPLTEQEWTVMRRHPAIGERILQPVERLRNVARLVRHHQERWDGTGYPDGLAGDTIPLGARILATVDAYGAMIDRRPYKQARSHEEAVAELRRCAGTQFDPDVVAVFVDFLQEQRSSDARGS